MVSFALLNAVDASAIVFIVLLVVMIIALLVVPMFTNKKRAKQAEEQYRSLRPGTLIKTVGGIIGTVKEIRQVSPQDREMIIETGEGDNKTTMTFDIMALYQVLSPAVVDEPETENTDTAVENSGEVFGSENIDTNIDNNAENTVSAENAIAEDQTSGIAATESVVTDTNDTPAEENTVVDPEPTLEEKAVSEEPAAVIEDNTAAEAVQSTESADVVEPEKPAVKKPAAKKPIAKKSTTKKPAAKNK